MDLNLSRFARAGLVFTALGAGCGGSSDWPGPRFPVSGTVKLAGEPLPRGRISFVPLEDGPATQAEIADGTYSIPAADGPGHGPYRVEINSIQGTGTQVFDPDENRKVEKTRNLIPPSYNAASTIHVEVKGDGPCVFDFDVKPSRSRTR